MFEYHQKVDEPSRWMLTELEEKGKSFSMVGDYRIKQMIADAMAVSKEVEEWI